MKLVLNFIKWIAIVAAGLIVILFSLSIILQDKVIDVFLKSLNNKLSTKIDVGAYSLSLLKKFPRASVELKDVSVLSSPGFDKSQFEGRNADTLLKAASASLEFSMKDLIKSNYNIESITVKNGNLNLFSDSSGSINYDIRLKSSGDSSVDNFVINLERINVTGLQTTYTNTATKLNISGIIENGRFKSRISDNTLDFLCSSTLKINTFDLYSTHIRTNASASVDVNLHQSASGILFKKGSLKLENFNFGLSGFISSDNILDLKISGQNIDVARIKKYLPEKYIETFLEYSPSGILKTDCQINGLLSRTRNPNISLSFALENGHVNYASSNISIKDLSFSGGFTNGKLNRPETSMFYINRFGFVLGSATCTGDFSLSDFVKPEIKMSFSGEIISSELLNFIKVPEITSTEGSFRVNLKMEGKLVKKEKYTLADFIDLNPEANIQFKSFGLTHKNGNLSVEDVDGNIMFAKNLWAEDLVVSYKGQRFRINGEFTNLPAWLAGKPVQISAVADVSVGNLNPEIFMPDSTKNAGNGNRAFMLPQGVELHINYKIDNLVYRTFSAEKISGTITYKPGILNFKTFDINSLNGSVSGNYLIAQNQSKSYISKGSFVFDNIDVNLAFRSFKNFGQDFIVADNLAGNISGSISLLMPLDSLLNPDVKSLVADGKYTLVNGVLQNFEPIKALSKFIEVSELENITFSRLENDLFIKNNYLAFPQMDINSSAADFTISGKHDFDNNYEYHVKTYLSEVLSKKRVREKQKSDEFGAIEEDGLGRTSIFLKITGKDDNAKVSYDLKAARGNTKQNLKNEKGNLKNILNKEFGWFKRDTTIRQEPAPKPKYRIEWSETDNNAAKKDTIVSEKDKGNSRIFKKKKIFQLN